MGVRNISFLLTGYRKPMTGSGNRAASILHWKKLAVLTGRGSDAAGANVFAFARYCPTSEEKDTNIEPLRYRQLLADCDRKFKEYEAAGCQTYFNKKDHLWTLYEYETGTFQIPETVEEGMIYGGCNCGNCHLTIVPNGDVYACRRVQNSKVGNVFSDRLADVWVCQMEGYRDYSRFRKCAKCELLAFCRGCPTVASGKDGDFYAADPQCWKEVG